MMKSRVLFLCTGNSARSHLRRLGSSAGGFEPIAREMAQELNPLAIAVMREAGIDISDHQSKSAASLLGQHFPYVITVCDQANERCPIFLGVVQRLHWSLQDPALAEGSEAERLTVFRRVRDEIGERVRSFVAGQPATR